MKAQLEAIDTALEKAVTTFSRIDPNYLPATPSTQPVATQPAPAAQTGGQAPGQAPAAPQGQQTKPAPPKLTLTGTAADMVQDKLQDQAAEDARKAAMVNGPQRSAPYPVEIKKVIPGPQGRGHFALVYDAPTASEGTTPIDDSTAQQLIQNWDDSRKLVIDLEQHEIDDTTWSPVRSEWMENDANGADDTDPS